MAEPPETDGVNGWNLNDREKGHRRETLYGLFNRMLAVIFFPDPDSKSASSSLLQRIKTALAENLPLLKSASRNTARDVLVWTRRGSPLRALLVISVGTITLLALTGLLVFMLFFLAATVNAIIISLLMSLAAAGGFLALFFACVTAVYVGALTIAAFVITTATVSAIVATIIATGWIGFFWTIWLMTKKSVGVAKRSWSITGSAISAYSHTRQSEAHRSG